MGILTEMAGGQFASPEKKREGLHEAVISKGASIIDNNKTFQAYHGLEQMLESESHKERYMAGLTLTMLERVQNLMEAQRETYGEAVVQASLGTLPKRVMDIVRIFYPNQIAAELVDIQPIDGKVGSIFTMTPRFVDSVAGVSAGDEIFRERPTYSNYASEEATEVVGTGDGTTTAFSDTASTLPVRPSSVKVERYTSTGAFLGRAVDDGNGNLVGAGDDALTSGTIDYATGALSIDYATAPATGVELRLVYCYDTETNTAAIRAVEFDLQEQPVTAKIHPLNFRHSVAGSLTAQAHFAIDVQDTLAQLAATYIKVERDEKLVRLINANATAVPSLNFDATHPSGYQRNAFYGEIELKLDEAESQIQAGLGRGGVDWVLCGRNAANIFKNVRDFQAVDVNSPIGPHVIGTMRNGTVTVIKVINDTVLGANDFIFGYKGYMAGDAATILAEWIPVYFTPTFQSPQFQNETGVMSMYDMFVNNAGYYKKGSVTNYGA